MQVIGSEMDRRGGSMLMEKYELGRQLGQGAFAKVYYARCVRTGQSVAIKMIDKEKVLRRGLVEQIKREISIMRLIRHPNVLQLYEVMATKTKIYFVIEYAKGGELFDKVANGKLKENVARMYFQQLINAVEFCHSRGVYHRDLKPENLLLDENENLKVSDFGLSALAESKRQDGLLHTTCGTPAYCSPEVINRKGYDGAKADIWSCGVILFVLLAGYLPFHDRNLMELYRKIGRAQYRCPRSLFPTEVQKLLSKILDPNPSTRISISKIKENPWFKKGLSQKSRKTDPESSTNASSSLTESSSGSTPADGKDEVIKPTNLNAFDIISLSSGFDLSGFFEEPCQKKETRFTSRKPASVIISKLEEVAKLLKMRFRKQDKGLLKFEGVREGRKGVLSIDAEIFEVASSFYMVEMKKCNGDTLKYQKILREGVRPALQDIVWAWQGDPQQPQQLPPEVITPLPPPSPQHEQPQQQPLREPEFLQEQLP